MTLDEKLEEIKHRKLDLTDVVDDPIDNHPHRPELVIWAEGDDRPAHVVLTVSSLWGQHARYVDLGPLEARQLAKHLIAMADAIDHVVDNYEPPDPPGFEAGFAANH